MIAITTSSSMSVKPEGTDLRRITRHLEMGEGLPKRKHMGTVTEAENGGDGRARTDSQKAGRHS